ncbi:hypothetical protein C8A00DRAFT_32432 [Chaetomidium leptoderma]|uniref:Dynamin N-terminal domain-containing protein n=1 Tax=Chaetomidium leptoderma TaxID=669021 RepID=A0AAN6ZYF7_9PEZI|nr:hypothetical protein C8A00DRAFT_32432 [Chaetomidium leptoderma]
MQLPADTEPPVKSEAVTLGLGAAGDPFAWGACSDQDLHTRVFVKQQAVDDALRHASKIYRELRAPVDDETSSEERCGRELVEWMEEIDKLHETSQAFEILIGVAGRTGAGKSTILNMLLEVPELLPSSNSEAATSCACRVSWNDDDAPEHQFRAEVVFRSPEDVAQELQHIFAMVQQREQLNEEADDDDNPFERMEEEAETQCAIAEGFKKIGAIWGLDQEDVESMTPKDLLVSNPEVFQLLGTTKTIYSQDAEKFAEVVKPYMDSSENLQGFRAWPLITEVRLFVKAPFLKHGVVLVDLPGLSDAVESRAEVANKFSKKLEITAIVAPARRAIDEKTGVQLMSDYQTLRMQLDGKYHKKSFCVVVSQIDEIDCDVFIKGDATAKQDQDLQRDTREIKVLTERSAMLGTKLKADAMALAKIEEKVAKVSTKLVALKPTGRGSKTITKDKSFQDRAAKIKDEQKAIKKERTKQKKTVERSTNIKAGTDRDLETLRAQQKWACISMRNKHIIRAIQRDFAARQKALSREMRQKNEYDGSVDVIPVSATAFRDHLKGREPMGFPTRRHTGIPRLRQWLADSTLERREAHLDALLNALRRLFLSIQQWSLTNGGGQSVQFSRDTIQELLSRTHAKFLTMLETELRRGSDAVKTLDPFKEIEQGRALCKREYCKAATRLAVKTPEDHTSAVLMHWTTFNAILKRNGGPHYCRGREKREYNFPEAMTASILKHFLKVWHKTFRVEIPSAEVPIMNGIETIWHQYLEELRDQIQATAPDILPHFEDSMHTIRGIMSEMRDRVHVALKCLSECSSDIHPQFLDSLRSQLTPIFEAALDLKGTGHFQHRRRHLYDRVKAGNDAMFNAGYKRMARQYAQNLGRLPHAFAETAAFAGAKVAAQLTLMLDRLEGASGGDWAVVDMQPSLQQRLQTAVVEWQMDWRLPKRGEESGGFGGVEEEEVGIPRGFVEEGGEQLVVVKTEAKAGESDGEEGPMAEG